jgi:hypothetical protein
MSDVTVTNTGKEDFHDAWDGKVYSFPPKQPVVVSRAIAHHIFGHGETDKEPYVVRLGWTDTRKDLHEGLARLAKFKIDDPDQSRPSLAPGAERVPLQSPKETGGKLAIASP